MNNSLIRTITLAASLLFLPAVFQPAFAAGTMPTDISGVEKININKADKGTLSMIKGIGEKKAQAIIDYRNSMGKFKSLDDLVNVKGIGESTLNKIKPYLTL